MSARLRFTNHAMPSPWKLTVPNVTLETESLSGSLRVNQPHLGLSARRPFSTDASLFQVLIGSGTQKELPVADAYTRLNDLIVTFAEQSPETFTSQIYWRYLDGDNSQGLLGGIDLIVSAQTSLLDARPEVATRSEIGAAEAWRLVDVPTAGFELIGNKENKENSENSENREVEYCFTPQEGAGCFLFRPKDEAFSYIEMVHPVDFSHSTLTVSEQRRLDLKHVVIDRWMEKGVIVRARLRGAVVQREDDTQSAGKIYRDFCNAKIPLTV